jgi:hypothetical protein
MRAVDVAQQQLNGCSFGLATFSKEHPGREWNVNDRFAYINIEKGTHVVIHTHACARLMGGEMLIYRL